jgi:hypothetical protein
MAMSCFRAGLLIAVTSASCRSSTPNVPQVRFVNSPPVTLVNDRRNVPTRPEVTSNYLDYDYYTRAVRNPLEQGMALPTYGRAQGTNSIDEVPDSTWFTNRIGVRELSPEEIQRGPGVDDGPEAHKPWTIISTKGGATELGFIIRDARGVKYGLGFDAKEWPELQTGTGVVVNRLLYAAGYNVPDDRVAYVRPDELVLSRDAVIKDQNGKTTGPLFFKDLRKRLAEVYQTPDGRIRVLASRWIDGVALGGTPPSGLRAGDPNDRIRHQDRRDLRGQYPIFAWVDHVDLVRGNFLDTWITAATGKRYVMHYLLDFNKSLGVIGATLNYLRAGHEYLLEWKLIGSPLFTFGLAPRPWGHEWAPPFRGVSPTFLSSNFSPGGWKPVIQYAPFTAADRFDKFWGAKIVGRFTPEQIRAAVEAGQFTSKQAVDYLTKTLIERQRMTEEYWYGQVNPLDHFKANGGLCFEDLAITNQFIGAEKTRYELMSYDHSGHPLGDVFVNASQNGTTCTPVLKLAQAADGYTIVRVTTIRGAFSGTTYVHIAKDRGTGGLHVIGIWRI